MQLNRIHTSPRFSRAVVHGQTAYLSGIIPTTATASAADQTREVLAKLDAMLAKCGTDKTKLLSTTLLLTDLANIAEINSVWDAWVAPGHAPARTPIVTQLNGAGLLVEVVAIAAI